MKLKHVNLASTKCKFLHMIITVTSKLKIILLSVKSSYSLLCVVENCKQCCYIYFMLEKTFSSLFL